MQLDEISEHYLYKYSSFVLFENKFNIFQKVIITMNFKQYAYVIVTIPKHLIKMITDVLKRYQELFSNK